MPYVVRLLLSILLPLLIGGLSFHLHASSFKASAASIDLPTQPGDFWIPPSTAVPAAPPAARVADAPLRFTSLSALTDYALSNRPESRAAWLAIQAEAARLDAERAAYWPSLNAQFNFTQSQGLSSSGATVPVLNRYGPSLSLSYVLFDFGARRAGIEAQRYQLIARLLNSNRGLQDGVARLEEAYFAMLASKALVQAQAEQETALTASLDAVTLRLNSGLVARGDELRARAALAEARLARHAAERDLQKAEAALKQSAGIAQTRELQFDWQTPMPDALQADLALIDLLDVALQQRPDLRALQASSAAARAEADRARAARWPVLSLSGTTGRTSFLEQGRASSTTYSVGVTVSVPLFDGGRLRGLARAAERDADRLQAEQEVQSNVATREVSDAWYDTRHAQSQRADIADLMAAASESARAAEARYRAGVGSLLELLTAQADLARARLTSVQSESDWLAAFSRLSHALGRLPATAASSPSPP